MKTLKVSRPLGFELDQEDIMPIYEYQCSECGCKFEKRRPIDQADAAIACPQCGCEHARRGLSRFAAFSKGSGGTTSAVAGSGGCSGCSSHSCGTCGGH